jgi:hypothetical protein
MFESYGRRDSLSFTELPSGGVRAELSRFAAGDLGRTRGDRGEEMFAVATGLGVYHGSLFTHKHTR